MNKAFLTAATAFSLVAAPTMAAAAPVQTPLTQPATEAVGGESQLAGRSGNYVVLVFAIIAITLGILAATRGNSRPNSP